MATGLLNWGMGMMNHGPSASANGIPVGPGGAQNVNTGDTHIYNGNVGPQLSVTQNGVQGSGMQDWQGAANSQARTTPMVANNAGSLPTGP
jgi:hypothetical protein